MRTFVIILVGATAAASSSALAQTTPNVVSPTPGLSTPITSTTTNCMMFLQLPGVELQNGMRVACAPYSAS